LRGTSDLDDKKSEGRKREKVRAAYDEIRRTKPKELPPWNALSLAMREMIIHVFYAGRRDEAQEIEAQRRRLGQA
jgi:hypothetical protein